MSTRTQPSSNHGKQPSSTPSKSREATIVRWAQRLMITKKIGWSRAMSEARDLYGEE